LFNPNASHNLGNYAVKEFIKLFFKKNTNENTICELSVLDFLQLDFDSLEVSTEKQISDKSKRRYDLLIYSAKEKFVILIENKIYSEIGNNQLSDYRDAIEKEYEDCKKVFIVLSFIQQDIAPEEKDF